MALQGMLVEEVRGGRGLRRPSREYKRRSRKSIQDQSYILRLAVEADQRAFAGVQVLGGGNGGGEEGERAAQYFEARIYNSLSHVWIVWFVYRSSILPALRLELLPPLVGLSVCVGSVEEGVALIWT